jgi:N-acetylglucosaminyldiphosphoundecaprenol N-acetyl-beta-D-mannosaminyltransferase
VTARENGTGSDENRPGRRTSLMRLPLDQISEAGAIAYVIDSLEHGRGGWVITANLDFLCQFRARPQLLELFEQADLVVADGMPLVWASRLQGTPLPERVAGSELVWSLTAEAALSGRSVCLLGDEPDVREAAERRLCALYPGLRVADSYSPPLGFEDDPAELEHIRARLLATRPDIVYVALGFPKQEKLIEQLRADLPTTWFLGVGCSLSFIAGRVRRAPGWATRLGLEWLHRLAQEPRRLAKRYLVHDLPCAAQLFAHAMANRLLKRETTRERTQGRFPSERRVVFVRGELERARAAALAELELP